MADALNVKPHDSHDYESRDSVATEDNRAPTSSNGSDQVADVALADIVALVQRDSRTEPAKYLKETDVPFGGE